MDITKIWSSAQDAIKTRIGDIAFNTWFGPVKIKSDKTNNLTLELPDNFFKEWFTDHYLELTSAVVKELAGQDVVIDLIVNPAIIKKDRKDKLQVFESRIKEPRPDDIKLNPKYTFENFVVGPSNRFTHAASLAVAESPAKNYNPLFIYGGVGLGKTHLMQAICHFVKKRSPQVNIAYLTSERFTNELINAIQHHSMENFRKQYRSMDILLLDDIHFIAGKEATQEEFFHTFNSLYDAHKQIIISSDRPPKEINKLEERLISRFSWGLITDVQPPDLETRIAILKKKVENEKTKIPDDVIHFLAESIKNNIRELEGALVRLVAYSVLEGKNINLTLARDILKDTLRETVKNINIDTIQKKVANFYNLNVNDFKAKKRNKNIVIARQIAMYLARELTNLSLPEIGQSFGGKDHTTVLHSYNKIKNCIETDVKFKELLNRVLFEVKN
ncbi:MAG: chromosomal replication initiator protein DnaA [Candidatus Omnitrophica bacterium]|nr:chromosomal replication initiator protein DnaA [Candidatus Omnitrophota bacterium]MDD5351610.1 chromosomal replication initiator protein DnaA [Candidatus Omnitrophota bacterium]MDD5550819.1 chromosomal replication initiator protein DnaA [Candidatus Omnitrophota bacterium]